MIINLQNFDTWKIQLTIAIDFDFESSKDAEEERVILARTDNIIFTFNNCVNEVVDKLFESLRSRYQENLATSMTESDFISDLV